MSGATARPAAPSGGAGAWITADPFRAVLAAIAVVTVVSGSAQIPFGAGILTLLGAGPTPAATQLFATVGMFMVVVGGLLLHTLLLPRPAREAVLWCGIQKAGAFAAVGIAVLNGIFAPVALAVAFFDLATAVLLLLYWRRLDPSPVPGPVRKET
ncbi:hypothetical protein [Pseudarthrobacter sp. N5]|uniref:hypothetical protein n=1 Tax=Pseudarthrobacter sp. N5 TaxID=3418416 RepID=UPI003CF52095